MTSAIPFRLGGTGSVTPPPASTEGAPEASPSPIPEPAPPAETE